MKVSCVLVVIFISFVMDVLCENVTNNTSLTTAQDRGDMIGRRKSHKKRGTYSFGYGSSFGALKSFPNFKKEEKIVPVPVYVKVPVEKAVPIHVPKPYPVAVEKLVPYPVKVPVEVPVKVPVEVPVKVPVEVQVKVPQPYPVLKKVPVPVKVPVDRPVPVHVLKPYPVYVEKQVPYPVKVPVDRPYPVYVPLEKPQSFPMKIEKPVHSGMKQMSIMGKPEHQWEMMKPQEESDDHEKIMPMIDFPEQGEHELTLPEGGFESFDLQI